MADGYTSKEFQTVREALLARITLIVRTSGAWILRWIDDYGRLHRDAETLPEKGC
jgi:hypothetical protein